MWNGIKDAINGEIFQQSRRVKFYLLTYLLTLFHFKLGYFSRQDGSSSKSQTLSTTRTGPIDYDVGDRQLSYIKQLPFFLADDMIIFQNIIEYCMKKFIKSCWTGQFVGCVSSTVTVAQALLLLLVSFRDLPLYENEQNNSTLGANSQTIVSKVSIRCHNCWSLSSEYRFGYTFVQSEV